MGVTITINNNALGSSVTSTDDSVSGMILTGTTVAGAGNITVGVPVQLFSLADAESKGITEMGVNSFAWWHINDFYDMATAGTELWVMLVGDAVTMDAMLDKDGVYAPVLIRQASGTIRKLAVTQKSIAGVTIANGLDETVDMAMIKGKSLREYFESELMPFRFIVDGKDWTGVVGDLKDYNQASFNSGGICLGTNIAGKNAAVGLALGSMAALPVQRKISRVKNGALPIADNSAFLTDGQSVESHSLTYDAIAAKAYFFIKKKPLKSGYWWSSDRTATSTSDDFSSFARGFVIDKAYLLAYKTYDEEVDDEVAVTAGGLIHPAAAKSLQNTVENTIDQQMVQNGEAESVTCIVATNQNVVSTGNVDVQLGVQPKGYKSTINVALNFTL